MIDGFSFFVIQFYCYDQEYILSIGIGLTWYHFKLHQRMKKYYFTGLLQTLILKAEAGTARDIDEIMVKLTSESDFAMTRYVDFSLSLVTNPEGFERIKHYLFHGTLIQRNYASLYLNRLGERKCVKEAYEKGLIDAVQAFAR